MCLEELEGSLLVNQNILLGSRAQVYRACVRSAETWAMTKQLEGYLLTGRHGFFASYEAFIRIEIQWLRSMQNG